MTMQKEEERQNRVLMEIIDNAKELPVESQNLLLILARGIPDRRDISTGTGRRCVLDSLLHCDRSAAAGGRDRLHGSEGGGGYRAGDCVYI